MKSIFLLPVILFSITYSTSFSQTDYIDYFGQEPPGDSAIIFAPDSISLNDRKELKITFSPDGKACIIGTVLNSVFRLLNSVVINDHWIVPVPVNFTNTSNEREPMISPNNDKLFFTSPQSSSAQLWETDIWVSDRVDSGWSVPEKLPEPINSSSEEWHPTITSDGTIYFCSNRNGKYYIFRSKLSDGQYKIVEKLSNKINCPQYGSSDPYIAPDESYMVYTTGENSDQSISYKKEDGSWTSPKNLGNKINSNAKEYGSFISYDQKYYFFSRIEDYGLAGWGDIYWVNTNFIDSLRYTNFQPQVLNLIPDQIDTAGNLFVYTIPDSIFYDEDGNETLTLTAKLNNDEDLPDWLGFYPDSKTFEGTATSADYYNIRVTATDTAGASVSDIYKLTVKEIPSSIYNKTLSDNIVVYPNPANISILVKVNNLLNINSYEIFGLNGKIVKQGIFQSETIDISGLNKGLYTIVFKTDNGMIGEKIVVE